MNRISSRHILSISDLMHQDIELILDTADSLKEILARPIKKVPPLRGRTVVNLFFEPSTRTRLSFELAAKRLSADTVSVAAAASSVVKGETLIDTARNVEAMRPDVIVLRHSCSGAPHLMANYVKTAAVINAGDGMNEHPTQALLDLFTVKEHFGRLSGLKVAIIGDIAHSRVAHSDILAFTKMGADVFVSGAATMFPVMIETMGARVVPRPEEAIEGADVVMALRIQKERQGGRSLIPSVREYAAVFGLTSERMRLAKPGAVVMHPGPINRGVEMAPELADGPYSVILDQVTNGVAVRMAILSLILPEDHLTSL
ncbi:MAG: aspartate carbamoyltransferase catalytic subunit [Desulfobacteraceae bacterium]|nr:aspartate carbamoyltransferase catalytic subunit [Desulfobacteraceae bacterium]